MKRLAIVIAFCAAAFLAFAQEKVAGPEKGSLGFNGTMSYGNSYFGIRWYAMDSFYLDPYIGTGLLKSKNQGSYIGYVGVKGVMDRAVLDRLRAGFGARVDGRVSYQTMKSGSPSETLQLDISAGPVFALQYLVAPKLGIYCDYSLLYMFKNIKNMDTGDESWEMRLDTQTAALGIVFYL
jgi:hypothetical protein